MMLMFSPRKLCPYCRRWERTRPSPGVWMRFWILPCCGVWLRHEDELIR